MFRPAKRADGVALDEGLLLIRLKRSSIAGTAGNTAVEFAIR